MVNKIIAEYMGRNKRLIVPEFGAFIKKENEGNIVFVPFLKKDDGVLAEEIATGYGIRTTDASTIINEYVAEIRDTVANNGSYLIEGLGRIKVDANHSYYLEYNPADKGMATSPITAAKPSQKPTETSAQQQRAVNTPSPAQPSSRPVQPTSFQQTATSQSQGYKSTGASQPSVQPQQTAPRKPIYTNVSGQQPQPQPQPQPQQTQPFRSNVLPPEKTINDIYQKPAQQPESQQQRVAQAQVAQSPRPVTRNPQQQQQQQQQTPQQPRPMQQSGRSVQQPYQPTRPQQPRPQQYGNVPPSNRRSSQSPQRVKRTKQPAQKADKIMIIAIIAAIVAIAAILFSVITNIGDNRKVEVELAPTSEQTTAAPASGTTETVPADNTNQTQNN